MSIKTLVPIFGGNRMNADKPGLLLKGCNWCGVPFAGGMPEVPCIDVRTIVVNDKHRFIINLAMTAADPILGPKLYRKLRRVIFHPDSLDEAQNECLQWADSEFDMPDGDLALKYFISCWMGRSGNAGTDGEFNSSLAIRWNAAGGDSVVRYGSATKMLLEFRRAAARCTFTCLDAFDFMEKVKDEDGHGLYVDAPWPEDGDKYKHRFPESDQRKLAAVLGKFENVKIVVRYGDRPLIRELYQDWNWNMLSSRTQANKSKSEVLLTNFLVNP